MQISIGIGDPPGPPMSFADERKMRKDRVTTTIERPMTSLSAFYDYRASVPVCGATK
jgi:hypothetical protein